MIRVRFAPSPTGFLHIGGVRTALFNFLYARQQGGKFLLRIEDTDRLRSTPEFEQEILDSLRWLGLDWDEDLVHQSSRLERYREVANELIAKGLAYEQRDGDKVALTFRMPKIKVTFTDLVHGDVTYDSNEFDDLVIMKSDGFPTFHLAVIVDDHDMGITHVVRGDDHLPNTPRHILIHQALGWRPPKYAHLPLIMGADGTPLSKRHGAVAVSAYRNNGYLPEGLLNYLALLGWNPGTNQEILKMPELVKQFSFKRVVKSNAQFNPEKLLWLNGQHIRQISGEDYEKRITEFWKAKGELPPEDKWRKLITLYRPRLETFSQLMDQAVYCFKDPEYTDAALLAEVKGNVAAMGLLRQLRDLLAEVGDFEDVALVEQKTKHVAEAAGLKPKDIIHPLRFVLTGGSASPGIFELMSLIGKEACLRRLNAFLS
ncbi:MAG TPA: glutamate--tRNA ligase [Candidatus Omnitrophota bacterium]|nr:glutamate--tRNA ligase [Candidatus Omnitrophota bacterium]HPS37021.1 glutamate--tRNA ligase [Candidatus Omnitrophota bacterium]